MPSAVLCGTSNKVSCLLFRYSASPIPPMEAVRKYFETYECGYTQRLLTAYKAEVEELYSCVGTVGSVRMSSFC